MAAENQITKEEIAALDMLIAEHIEVKRYHLGSTDYSNTSYDRRPNMYGGDGVVYLLQMFAKGELVHNRIGAYMVIPSKTDSVGFHSHGPRKEQELYLVVHGHGVYLEKMHSNAEPQKYALQKGNITSIKGEAYHAIRNTGDEPLIIFVITTYE